MTRTQEQLIRLIRKSIVGNINNPDSELDIKQEDLSGLLSEARLQAIVPIAFFELPLYESEDYKAFKKEAIRSITDNNKISRQHALLGKAFKDNNIPCCFIKGCASAIYYKNPDYRVMGDIDILVNEEDMERSIKLLEAEGYVYKEVPLEHPFHTSYVKDNICVELHFSVGHISEVSTSIQSLTEDIIDSSKSCGIRFGDIKIPTPFYHGLIMLLHMYRHFTGSGFGLRHLYDWAVFVDSKEYESVFDDLYKASERWGLLRFMETLSNTCRVFFGTHQPLTNDYDSEICKDFMEAVLDAGNFGIKTKGSIFKLFVNQSFANVSDNYFSNFKSSMKDKIYERWPKARHSRALFLKYLSVYLFTCFKETLTGKRKFPMLRKDFKKAEDRKKLFENLSDKN